MSGWLNAIPKGSQKSRLDLHRAQSLDPDEPPEMPPCGPAAAYLVELLFLVGPLVAGEVLSYSEISAFDQVSGYGITPLQARALRELSGEYAGARNAGADPQAPAPWERQPRSREDMEQSLVAFLKGMAKKG